MIWPISLGPAARARSSTASGTAAGVGLQHCSTAASTPRDEDARLAELLGERQRRVEDTRSRCSASASVLVKVVSTIRASGPAARGPRPVQQHDGLAGAGAAGEPERTVPRRARRTGAAPGAGRPASREVAVLDHPAQLVVVLDEGELQSRGRVLQRLGELRSSGPRLRRLRLPRRCRGSPSPASTLLPALQVDEGDALPSTATSARVEELVRVAAPPSPARPARDRARGLDQLRRRCARAATRSGSGAAASGSPRRRGSQDWRPRRDGAAIVEQQLGDAVDRVDLEAAPSGESRWPRRAARRRGRRRCASSALPLHLEHHGALELVDPAGPHPWVDRAARSARCAGPGSASFSASFSRKAVGLAPHRPVDLRRVLLGAEDDLRHYWSPALERAHRRRRCPGATTVQPSRPALRVRRRSSSRSTPPGGPARRYRAAARRHLVARARDAATSAVGELLR